MFQNLIEITPKMFEKKEIFNFFWENIKFYGLQHHKVTRQKLIRGIFCFITLIGSNLILYLIELIVNGDKEKRIHSLQTFPPFFQMGLEFSNFIINSKAIEKLFESLDKFYANIKDESFFESGYNYYRIYYTIFGLSLFYSIAAAIIIFGATGKNPMLVYTPYPNGFGFFCIWFLQTAFIFYGSLLVYLLDQPLISLIIFLSFYLKAIKKKIIAKENLSYLKENFEMILTMRG